MISDHHYVLNLRDFLINTKKYADKEVSDFRE